MLKKLRRNKKGVADVILVTWILIGLATTVATVKTAKNGVLQNNGKKIRCKVTNKGNDYCDAIYR